MTAPRPTEVTMHELLASCAAARAVSVPPRAPQVRPERPAEPDKRAADGPARHPRAA
ncbi:hypothetical protein [Streptomyces sp. NPDC048191]|uniref:hypothetical protein n=1 Tax=Streptomyces sp. NPDC048191 TaxID=3155484 RepID=UPI0033CA4698